MFGSLAKKIFGSVNDRRLKSYRPKVAAINAIEAELEALSDEELRARTDDFKAELAAGKSLDDILVPAFATVREAAKRTLGQRHFDVQLIGGMVLHEGAIAEMRTGEGKTLVATLPVYLNALAGKGVHVVTVNDYLARRDAEWMGQIYKFLGLYGRRHRARARRHGARCSLCLRHHLRHQQRVRLRLPARQHEVRVRADGAARAQLRHRRRGRLDPRRRGAHAAHHLRPARRPLRPLLRHRPAHPAPAARATTTSTRSSAPSRSPRAATSKIEELLREAGLLKEGDLYDAHNATLVHHVNQALRAHTLFQRDKDYIVRNGEVVIIDEFTGRMMPGRRYSEGLHQALEAKERVQVQPENQTLASITFQNYFRLYEQARRHDRHGGDRGRRVPWRSTTSKSSRSRPTCRSPASTRTTRSTGRRREVQGHHPRDRGGFQPAASRSSSARPRSRSRSISPSC